MKRQAVYSLVGLMLLVLLLSSQVYAGSNYERPKYKMSFSSGGSNAEIGNVILFSENSIPDDPQQIDHMRDPNNRLNSGLVYDNHRDINGRFQLGYNFDGPWYLNGGLFIESKDQVGIPVDQYVTQEYRESYIDIVSVIPYLSIEYTNRFWKLNYNSSIGLAYCASRADVRMGAGIGSGGDPFDKIGTYTYNSAGIILSGGLGYEIYRHTSIDATLGYRFFAGNKLEPPDDLDYVPIDFDYDGVFFGIGMSFGFGRI